MSNSRDYTNYSFLLNLKLSEESTKSWFLLLSLVMNTKSHIYKIFAYSNALHDCILRKYHSSRPHISEYITSH